MAIAKPIKSVLIANRGEIAVRVARTCRAMGIRSIAIFSDADAGALHARFCDEAVPIGGVSARESYLRGDVIIEAARRAGAQAIHPGYGFLSENADFAQACASAGIVFIGPPPGAMRAVGNKIAAKRTATAVGVPTLPGYLERAPSRDVLEANARRIGTPLLIKAAAGGGGRGMRLVNDFDDLGTALEGAQREAQASFGDSTVFLERFLISPRHIEVQILADYHGVYIALGERECSVQRRYQKILEESPSPAVDPELRCALEEAAVKLARAVKYVNAGTVEFMLDREGHFYFLEMNARLQVEHPVTELVTGTDLVREQIVIAAGGKMEIDKSSIDQRGHAIEVRIYAEDPSHGFLPSTGRITQFAIPQGPGIRNDVAVEAGSEVTPAYDPMLAKLIVQDRTRAHCIERLRAALDEYLVGGVATNIALLRWIAEQPQFLAGETSTDFLDLHFQPEMLATQSDSALAILAAAGSLQTLEDQRGRHAQLDPWQRLGAWRHTTSPRIVAFSTPKAIVEAQWMYDEQAWNCRAGGNSALVQAQPDGSFVVRSGAEQKKFAAWLTPDGVALSLNGAVTKLALAHPPTAQADPAHRHGAAAATGSVEAPMSGTIVKVNVQPNDPVAAFAVLLVMEAMKMEHSIVAPYPGKVTALHVQAGQSVGAGDVLAEISEA